MFADGDPSSLIAIPKMRTCWNLLHFLSGAYSDVGQQALSWKLKMLDIWPNCASACTVVGTGVMLLNPECFLQTSHTITFFHSAHSPTLNSLPPGINVCISLILSTASHEVSLKFFLILTKHEEENTFCTSGQNMQKQKLLHVLGRWKKDGKTFENAFACFGSVQRH